MFGKRKKPKDSNNKKEPDKPSERETPVSFYEEMCEQLDGVSLDVSGAKDAKELAKDIMDLCAVSDHKQSVVMSSIHILFTEMLLYMSSKSSTGGETAKDILEGAKELVSEINHIRELKERNRNND